MTKKLKFTEEQMKASFKKLGMAQDWQGRICAEVPNSEKDVIVEAILFYTGTEADITSVPTGNLKVMSWGYRKGPWANKTPEHTPY